MTDPRISSDEGSQKPRRGPLLIALALAAVILLIAVVVLVWLVAGQQDPDTRAEEPSFAATTKEEPTTEAGSSEKQRPEESGSGNVTVTETVDPSTSPDFADTDTDTDAARQHRRDRSQYPLVPGVPADKQVVPQCDGRGVLIVQSVFGDSGDVAGEINAALANNPGAVVYPPGVCPTIRGSVGGVDVHPVVLDYGNDFAGLCAAEAEAGDPNAGNARSLDQSAVQESPC